MAQCSYGRGPTQPVVKSEDETAVACLTGVQSSDCKASVDNGLQGDVSSDDCSAQAGPSASTSDSENETDDDAQQPDTPDTAESPGSPDSPDSPDSPESRRPPRRTGRTGRKNRRKLDGDVLELLESCPDAFGLRRSGRQRKEVQRYTIGNTSDEEDSLGKRVRHTRQKRRDSDDWKGGDSNSDESDSGKVSVNSNSSSGGGRRPKRKVTSAKKASVRTKRQRVAYSSDEESDDDGRGRPLRASRHGKKVNYREASDEDRIPDSDVLEWSEEEPATQETEGKQAPEQHETIEKILKHRRGRKDAIGSMTTAYNVEDRGDPNAGSSECHPDELELQFLIKWVGWAHIHNTWESENSLRQTNVKGLKKLENYANRLKEIEDWKKTADKEYIEYFECEQEMNEELYEQYKMVERIITHSKSKDKSGVDATDYFVKWQGLPYAESTWEDSALIFRWWKTNIEMYHQRVESDKIPSRQCQALRRRPKFVQLKTVPSYLGNAELTLRDYQLDGLNWLAHAWCKNNSVILADEMGLGKTIQTISYLSYLYEEHDVYGPFLMIVPLSTLAAWQKECEIWAPQLNVIIYLGDVVSRDIIRQWEWFVPGTKRLKFNCVLTTYEILLKDKAFLGSFDWADLVVDEAHRLKNDESLLYKALFSFSTSHRLLITGTPLQNSLKELWALLHFIMPDRFDSWEEFERQHQNSDKRGYASIHKDLEPYLLRRVKKDVEKSLPAKVEQILRVDMTSAQKQYYKWILTRNYRALTKGMKGNISSFINIVMELKKCCNHAWLVRPPEVEPTSFQERIQQIVRGSGKLILLDKLLCRLYQTGHRVLIFSQMVMVLDILQEYLRLRKFQFQRLDGSIRGDLRRQALDHFNAEGSSDFCFLLSTRAGGLGINLATADTVIIFDSDWNPQNDLQAQSRAHRIGQKKQVNIYRLVTKKSVEEEIVERAKQKLVLDHLVIQRMDTTGRTVLSRNAVSSTSSVPFDKEELASILKFGAEELFKEREGEEQDLEVDIDDILQRAETREMEDTSVANELLGSFKVANFTIDEDEDLAPRTKAEKSNDDKDWDQIIPEEERRKIEDEERQQQEAEMLLPPRQRTTLQQMARNEDSDDDWAVKRKKTNKDDQSDSEESEEEERRRGRKPRKALFGFTDAEIRRFVRSCKKFARPLNRLDAIACDAELEDHSTHEVKQLCEALLSNCQQALQEQEQEQKENVKDTDEAKKRDRGPVFKLGTSEFPVRPIIKAHEDLEPLYLIMPETAEGRKRFRLPGKVKALKNWDVEWTDEDDAALLRGVYEYGAGSWESAKMDPELGLAEKILLADKKKKPQAKHLQTRVDYLLKFLQKQTEVQKLMTVDRKRKVDTKSDKVNHVEKSKQKVKDQKQDSTGTSSSLKNEKPEKKNDRTIASGNAALSTVKVKSEKKRKNVEVEEGEIDDDVGPKMKQPKPSKKEPKSADKPLISAKTEHLKIDVNIDTDLDDDVFAECKELMRPVKKALKRLTSPESEDELLQCLLKIGDHISECLASKATNRRELSNWHTYQWLFVSKFTEYDATVLHDKYKLSLSRRNELGEEHENTANDSRRGDAFKQRPLAPREDEGKLHRQHRHHHERHRHRHHNEHRPSKESDTAASTAAFRPPSLIESTVLLPPTSTSSTTSLAAKRVERREEPDYYQESPLSKTQPRGSNNDQYNWRHGSSGNRHYSNPREQRGDDTDRWSRSNPATSSAAVPYRNTDSRYAQRSSGGDQHQQQQHHSVYGRGWTDTSRSSAAASSSTSSSSMTGVQRSKEPEARVSGGQQSPLHDSKYRRSLLEQPASSSSTAYYSAGNSFRTQQATTHSHSASSTAATTTTAGSSNVDPRTAQASKVAAQSQPATHSWFPQQPSQR